MPLRNRVALVTGASRGIGKEIALGLGRAGLRVAVAFRTNKLGAQKVLADLKAVGAKGSRSPQTSLIRRGSRS